MTRADDADFSTKFAPKGKNARNTIKRWLTFIVGFGVVSYGTLALVSFMTTMMERGSGPQAGKDGALHPRTFQPFTIVEKQAISSTCTTLVLRPAASGGIIATTGWNERAVAAGFKEPEAYQAQWEQGLWSVEFKQPQLQIARSYTPLPPTPSMEPGDLRFLIRREHKGEVSNYLLDLPVGETIGIRGPQAIYAIPDDVNEVVFLAGGTGIAPALQMVHTLFRARPINKGPSSTQPPKVRILWANRRQEDCAGGTRPKQSWFSSWSLGSQSTAGLRGKNAFVEELQALEQAHAGQLIVDFYCNEEKRFITPANVQAACVVDTGASRSVVKNVLVISGPEGFVSHFVGPKEWKDGVEIQGPIGGQIAKLKLKEWTVVKL